MCRFLEHEGGFNRKQGMAAITRGKWYGAISYVRGPVEDEPHAKGCRQFVPDFPQISVNPILGNITTRLPDAQAVLAEIGQNLTKLPPLPPTATSPSTPWSSRHAPRGPRGVAGNLLIDWLKASVGNFAALLPFITDLKNFADKQTFIQQTASPLVGNIFADKQFRSGCLFGLRAFHCADPIAAIS
jgi:hypothetical protein